MTVPWVADHTADTDWDAYASDVQARADDLAWTALRYLTGGRVGHGIVRLRPCAARCVPDSGYTATGPGWYPTIRDGEWYNVGCGHSRMSCSCAAMSEVIFPGEVATVEAVTLDGVTLADGTDYRLDSRSRLLRLNGEWPACQDMTAAWNATGAFTIDYVPGVNPIGAGLLAAGTLASEFAKALSGAKCKLPAAITSLSRQGITLDFQEGYFPNNVTGLLVVDAYVFSLNPKALRQSARVWSPDLPQYRTEQYVPPGN